MKVCIVGASGLLGTHMVRHALTLGHDVVGVCREKSVGKLDEFKGRITLYPGPTNDVNVIKKAVAGCGGVCAVLVPWGMHHYSSGTAQAIMDHTEPGARLVFSTGYHISRDGKDNLSRSDRILLPIARWAGWALRVVDIDDQEEAASRIFASNTRWTIVRAPGLEEGESQGMPVWGEHVGDPHVPPDGIIRRVDYAKFMVEALEKDELVGKAPAIANCTTDAARVHSQGVGSPESS